MSTVNSTDPIRSQRQSPVHLLSTLAVAGLLFFAMTAVVAQIMRPDLSPAGDFLSAYALGRSRLVMTAGFVAVGVSIVLLTVFQLFGLFDALSKP